MKTFIVRQQEVWIQELEVEANSEEEAREKILDGEGTEIGKAEYDYTLDNEEDWDIYEKD